MPDHITDAELREVLERAGYAARAYEHISTDREGYKWAIDHGNRCVRTDLPRLAKALQAANARKAALTTEFLPQILHGDEAHRRWLTEAFNAWVKGEKIPAVFGKGIAETLKARLVELEVEIRDEYKPRVAQRDLLRNRVEKLEEGLRELETHDLSCSKFKNRGTTCDCKYYGDNARIDALLGKEGEEDGS